MSTDILCRVFRILTEPVPYTFVSVTRRNNEARAHIAMWTPDDAVVSAVMYSLFRNKCSYPLAVHQYVLRPRDSWTYKTYLRKPTQ